MIFMLKKLYIKFILIFFKYSNYFIVLFTILYVMFLRYIYILNVENTLELILLEKEPEIVKEKQEIKINDYKPSYDYYNYEDDNLLPISVAIMDSYQDFIDNNIIPEFKVSTDDILSDTIITNPLLLDNHYPFETPVDLIIPEHKEIELIIYNDYNANLQKDIFHSIYSPGYKGVMTLNQDQIFDLHLKIVKIVSNHLHTLNEDLTQDQIIEHVKQIVYQSMIQYNIFNGLSIENLKNTQHIVNLLISEMIINSMITSEEEKRLLHLICRALICNILNHLESGSTNFKDYRIDDIISRFLQLNNDDV